MFASDEPTEPAAPSEPPSPSGQAPSPESAQPSAESTLPPRAQPPAESPPQPTEPLKKRGGRLKVALITIAAVIGLVIIGTVTGCGEDESTSAVNGGNGEVAAPVGEEPPAAEEEEEAATPTPTAIKTYAYKGSGKRVVKIKKPSGDPEEPVIAAITYDGGGNFAVWTLDENLRQSDRLVNTVGSYKGTVAIDFERGTATERIQIEASGPWRVVIKPRASARAFSDRISGKGDDVLNYTGGTKVASIAHSGSRNFAVWHYTVCCAAMLADEIGKYKGQSPLGNDGLLVITASGSWSVDAQ